MEQYPVDDSDSIQSSASDQSDPPSHPRSDTPERSSERRNWIQWAFRHTEIAAAILLSIATVATAWCAYQSSRWNGVQATSFAEAATDRSESNREFNLAMQLQSIDIELVTLWFEAERAGDDERLDFYETSLMRPELLQHLDEWVPDISEPDEAESAHPLVSDAYMDRLVEDSQRLQEEATAKFQQAKEANQTSDDYVLATVVFASVLFFAGIASKFRSERIRAGLIVLGFLMLIAGAVWIGNLPVQ